VRNYRGNSLVKDIENDNRRLYVKKISDSFPDESKSFLIKVLTELEPYESHPAFRFFLFYQIVELLLQHIYSEDLAEFRNEFAAPQNDNSIAMKELVESLREAMSEKNRLRRLLEANADMAQDFEDLRLFCARLCDPLGYPSESSPAHALYRVRNLLFHSFGSAGGAMMGDLPDLVDHFALLTSELSIRYKKPATFAVKAP
jgi:hypothetical protein